MSLTISQSLTSSYLPRQSSAVKLPTPKPLPTRATENTFTLPIAPIGVLAIEFFKAPFTKEQYLAGTKEIVDLSEAGDGHFKQGNFATANKYYLEAIQKTEGFSGVIELGQYSGGHSLPDLKRKLRYTELASTLVASQNALNKSYEEIVPDAWDNKDSQYSKMFKEYQAVGESKNVLASIGGVISITDETKAQSIIDNAKVEAEAVDQRIVKLKEYQDGFISNGYSAEQAKQLRGDINQFIKKPGKTAEEFDALEQRIKNSTLSEADKTKATNSLKDSMSKDFLNQASENERKANKAFLEKDFANARTFMDQANNALYYTKGDAYLEEKLNTLGLKLFTAEFAPRAERIRELMKNLKTADDLHELARNFTGLLVALGAQPEYRNDLVKRQSGAKSFDETYFGSLFDPFSDEVAPTGSKYFGKWYEKNLGGQVYILESTAKGYTATQLRALIKRNPQMAEIKKLNVLLREMSLFFYDPILGELSNTAKGTASPDTRFWAQRLVYGVSDVLLSNPAIAGYDAPTLQNKLNQALDDDDMAKIEEKFGSIKGRQFSNVAEVVAVYLMALDPAVQAGGIDGVFENDWPIDGVSRKYVSKNLKDIISTPQIKAQYKKQLSALKSYYEGQSSKEGRAAQIRLLDVLLEAAR